MKPQVWFEMHDARRRRYADASWIPLRASIAKTEGRAAHLGYEEDFEGVLSVAVPADHRGSVERLRWGDASLGGDQGPYAFDDGRYKTAESFQMMDGDDLGIHLVLRQPNPLGPAVWHLNQDFLLALRLVEEGDAWVCPDENCQPLVRRQRDAEGGVCAIFARADALRDYLAARGLVLRLITYRSRTSVEESAQRIAWPTPHVEDTMGGRFEGGVYRMHSGGDPEGATMAVFTVGRTDVDIGADVPSMGPETDEGTTMRRETYRRHGPVLERIEGRFYRKEWIEPAAASVRVRGDRVPSHCHFVVKPDGERRSADELNDEDCGCWLWFDASVVRDVLSLRGASLEWFTRDTGALISEVGGFHIHFGVNPVGRVNVYARDVAALPEWHRAIWAGKNLLPDGGLSEELAASQIHAEPSSTRAPEHLLQQQLIRLDALAVELWKTPLFRTHDSDAALLASVHRFRAYDEASFLELAKDLNRVFAERLDAGLLKSVAPPDAQRPGTGSLKSLERVLGSRGAADARSLMTTLVGVSELRGLSAHIAGSEAANAFALAGVDRSATPYDQAVALLTNAAEALDRIGDVLAQR